MRTVEAAVIISSPRLRARLAGAARRCARIITALALSAGALCCLRLAWADVLYRRSTILSVRQARDLIPYRAAYESRLASLLAPTDPDVALHSLKRAAELNPRDSAVLIQLGLRSEAGGEKRNAERYLLRAAEVDRTYEPRWTLANYYFRQSDAGNFRKWARRSAEMAYGDMRPLFRLSWEFSGNAANAESIVAASPDSSRQYLAWLLSEGRLDAAAAVAAARARNAAPADKDVLLYACERFLQSHRLDEAVRTWNALAAAGLIKTRPLDPARGLSITNEDFKNGPTGRGFDWHVPAISGITVSWRGSKQPLNISFSGRQAEHAVPIWQYAPVQGGSRCRLEFEYLTERIGAGTGLRWTVSDAWGADRLVAESPALSAQVWTPAVLEFTIPRSVKLARLALAYDRAAGTTRIDGSIRVRRIQLRLLP